jgi:hypothetical protein
MNMIGNPQVSSTLNPGNPISRRLGVPRAGLNTVENRKLYEPCWEMNLDFPLEDRKN